MNYPEALPLSAFCHMEGHEWLEGGICVRCGERLRCGCGQFVTVKNFDKHLKTCGWHKWQG